MTGFSAFLQLLKTEPSLSQKVNAMKQLFFHLFVSQLMDSQNFSLSANTSRNKGNNLSTILEGRLIYLENT
jgi:hypothetical protein